VTALQDCRLIYSISESGCFQLLTIKHLRFSSSKDLRVDLLLKNEPQIVCFFSGQWPAIG
jgi:hypothetical protein